MQLALRQVQATTTVVYDRPWSDAPGELNWIAPVDEGVSTSPAAIATVSDHEVAVLDTAGSRTTCFDLTGASTCSVPLPVDASGDLIALGDGTLIATDLRRRAGQQEFTVLRIDPRAGSANTSYHEYPMSVAGYPSIAENLAIETSPSGVIWMVIDSGSSNAGTSHELVRWRPGETTADTFPFDLRQGEISTRLLTVLDDHSVAFLDTNIGGRIREFTLP
jgi:hypothetical protein